MLGFNLCSASPGGSSLAVIPSKQYVSYAQCGRNEEEMRGNDISPSGIRGY